MKSKFKFGFIFISLLMIACSQKNTPKANTITEKDVTKASEASLYEQFNRLYYTKFLYKSAYTITEEDVAQDSEISLYEQFKRLYYTKFFYKSAYHEANKVTETNDQLLNYATFLIHAINTTYDSLNLKLSDDLDLMAAGKKSKISIDALDSLCVNNKYIEKYLQIKEKSGSKVSTEAKKLSKEALVLQPKVEKIIMRTDLPLNDIECKKLK
ncbi:hypothetical protein [Acinetobacter sp.]|uniref:hypothetical protein n=1 Tax=Acinetobacter sp. TaxID=472 RepID=UPI00281E465F|nr:hypothetical protein [Acinetobacter sp.]MDR2248609.1 hypothetical protein [Acinetobacter sp.]